MADEHNKDTEPSLNGRGDKIDSTGADGDSDAAKDSPHAEQGYHPHSRLIHGRNQAPYWDYSHHVVPPISSSATYRLSSAKRGALGFAQFGSETAPDEMILIYDRLQEPTSEMLENRIATAEGGETAVTFSTGMAAISAALGSILGSGDHVVSHECVYGCTASLFTNWYPRLGIGVSFVNTEDRNALEAAIRPETRVIYLETPVNPTMEIIDLAMVADVARQANSKRPPEQHIYTIVDNTFATPICQRPISLGIDIVVHSLTKGIGGFGTDMGGIVIAARSMRPKLLLYRKDFGGSLSPKAAWPPLVYGLPTLPVRMAKQQATAYEVARFIEAQPLTQKIRYPGLASDPDHALAKRQMLGYGGEFMPGSMMYFTLRQPGGDNRLAEAFIDYAADHAYTITLAVSLGQIKTLIENPCSMTHSALDPEAQRRAGIEPGGIRLSIGLEEPEDIIADLQHCYAHVAAMAAIVG